MTLMATLAQGKPFNELLWQKRIMVVFEQNDADRARAQRRMLVPVENEARDLVVVEVPQSGAVEPLPGMQLDAQTIRRSYGITDGSPFTVLLIGKDGGVKLRSGEPVAAKELFETIDAMPMRRREAQDN